jgi:hypothetical protein
MPRRRSRLSRFWSLFSQRYEELLKPRLPRGRDNRGTRRGRVPVFERLEDRTVPSVTFFNDPANPGKSVVRFT